MVLDVKEDAKETYTWIIEHFKENDEMLNHLVVSCYDVQDLEDVIKKYIHLRILC